MSPLIHDDHDLTEILLAVFPRHLVGTRDYKEVLNTARYYRLAVIPCSTSRRVLKSTEFGESYSETVL